MPFLDIPIFCAISFCVILESSIINSNIFLSVLDKVFKKLIWFFSVPVSLVCMPVFVFSVPVYFVSMPVSVPER